MRTMRRLATLKRAPRMRSVGRLRIDAAAELLRLEYERARLSALRGRLAGGLARADFDISVAQTRVGWVLDLLGGKPRTNG